VSERDRPIPESYWVEPGRFLAGEYPGRYYGEQLYQRLDSFLDFGINTFIDLTDSNELPSYVPELSERARYYELEIHYKRYTVTDFDIPTPERMKEILDAIDAALAAERKVYVHCFGGIGRTGTTVGCYLVRHGHTGGEALAQLAEWWQTVPKRRFWPRTPETDEQRNFILNWEE